MNLRIGLVIAVGISCISTGAFGANRPLNADDYLCTIFPPGCPKVAKSQSMDLVFITLYGPGSSPTPAGRPTKVIGVSRAFIDWAPYLKPEPQATVSLESAIPDLKTPMLVPDVVWKSFSKSVALNIVGGSDQDPQTRWVHIEIGLGNDSVASDLERLRSKEFFLPSSEKDERFRRFLPRNPDQPYYEFKDRQLLLPLMDLGQPAYLICDIHRDTNFNWCEVETLLGPGTNIRYQFEARQLAHFYVIDKAVRALVLSSFDRGKQTRPSQ